MDKKTFFESYTLKTSEFKLPDGKKITIHELTSEQRGLLRGILEEAKNPSEPTAKVVTMGCDMFDSNDVGKLLGMGSTLIKEMSDAILDLSGIGDDKVEEAKNA